MNYYHPQTGERIVTTTPAAWMGQTDIDPPDYNPKAQGCFWRGAAWELVDPAPAKRERREIMSELATLDAKTIRPIREGNAARIAELEAAAAVLRDELANLT